jgi:hypothetical protein
MNRERNCGLVQWKGKVERADVKALVEAKGAKIAMGPPAAAHGRHSVTVTPMALSIAARLAHSSAKTWSR